MQRDTESLKDTVFDLLVVGGGIHGAVLACKAAQRGLRVALAEKDDFASANSSNSLKILHGGLRYLQSLDFPRMRESIRARREIMKFAPHLVMPLPCAMPAYGHGLRGKEVMRLAMWLNDLIGLDRNRGLPADKRLPAGHTISSEQCQEAIPGIASTQLHGASVWYDALALNSERIVLEYLHEAQENGASCTNYLEVTGLARRSGNLIEATLKDDLLDEEFVLKSHHVVNCSGAAFESLAPHTERQTTPLRWARAVNIVVRKALLNRYAAALEKTIGAQKRMLFMVPWRENYTMIGTHYLEQDRAEPLFPVEKQAILAMIEDINAIYPAANLQFTDVSFYHAGRLPIAAGSSPGDTAQPLLAKRAQIIDHGKDGFAGFFSLNSIKYTTAPELAEKLLRQIKTASIPASQQRTPQQPPAPESETAHYLNSRYGRRWPRIKSYVDRAPGWLDVEKHLLTGEVDYFMREEMALHLGDIVFRRSDLGTAECPPISTLETLVERMGSEYSWNLEQRRAELKSVIERYAPLQTASF